MNTKELIIKIINPEWEHAQYVSIAELKECEQKLEAANDRIRLLISERDTARQQADQKHSLREEFRELLGTDDIEQGVAVVCDLKQWAEGQIS